MWWLRATFSGYIFFVDLSELYELVCICISRSYMHRTGQYTSVSIGLICIKLNSIYL
jgi:hypothetical protein